MTYNGRNQYKLTALNAEIQSKGSSLRKLAIQIGYSRSTLANLLKGRAPKHPLIANNLIEKFTAALKKLGIEWKFKPSPEKVETEKEEIMPGLSRREMEHFGLKNNPLLGSCVQTHADILKTNEHTQAIAWITQAIENGEFTILHGSQGTGKTTAIDSAIIEPPRNNKFRIVRFLRASMESFKIYQLIDAIARDLGTKYRGHDQNRKLEEIKANLILPDSPKLLTIIDDGHTINDTALFGLKRLWDNLKHDYRHLIGIVIVAQDHITSLLNEPGLSEVRTHVNSVEMFGFMNEHELREYIALKFRLAGGWDKYFAEDVPGRIFQLEQQISEQTRHTKLPGLSC